jgi:hypothetical protein
MSKQLYFKSVDDTMCYSLEQHLLEAKNDELKKVTLIKAEPDTGTNDYIWCTHYGDVVDRCECKKAYCDNYSPNKSGRGTCTNRGKLYLHGEEVEFEVS